MTLRTEMQAKSKTVTVDFNNTVGLRKLKFERGK